VNATAEIADAVNYPDIRLFNTALNTSTTPLDDLSGADLSWAPASPEVSLSIVSIAACVAHRMTGCCIQRLYINSGRTVLKRP
jgi:hypothetical protein